jgi:hypothetical protein
MNFQPFGHWKEYAPLTFRTVAEQVMMVPAVASGVGEGDGLDDAFGAVLTDDGDVEGPSLYDRAPHRLRTGSSGQRALQCA